MVYKVFRYALKNYWGNCKITPSKYQLDMKKPL